MGSLVQDVDPESWKQKILRAFVIDDRLTQIPAQRKKRLVVLQWLSHKFQLGVRYPERELNEIIKRYHPDVASLRRALVSWKFMAREGGVYWRVPKAEQLMALTHEVTGDENVLAEYTGRFTTDEAGRVGADAALDFPLQWTLGPVAKALAPRPDGGLFFGSWQYISQLEGGRESPILGFQQGLRYPADGEAAELERDVGAEVANPAEDEPRSNVVHTLGPLQSGEDGVDNLAILETPLGVEAWRVANL